MQVRWPIADLEAMARKKYGIKQALADYRVEGDTLVLYFTHQSGDGGSETMAAPEKLDAPASPRTKAKSSASPKIQRRRSGKRNRMRTRGWEIVAHFTNSKGQRCTIYRPFVEALKDFNHSEEERRARVREILKKNGNRPSEASIEYFMNNTLEFLRDNKGGA